MFKNSIFAQTRVVSSIPRGRAGILQAQTQVRMTSGSTRHGNDPEVLERNKQSLLRKHSKESTESPHWHEELASDSEAFVKSQREEIDSSEGEIVKLQQKSQKILETKNVKETKE